MVDRAFRYAIVLPIHYSAAGTGQWEEGVSLNLSGSGAMLSGEVAISPGTLIEFTAVLPHPSRKPCAALLQAEGIVVRSRPDPLYGHQFAVRMTRHSLSPHVPKEV